jgi:hypothetical protein
MSRDHYKGPLKKRPALINAGGDIEALNAVKADVREISGTATLTAGTVTVSDSRFVPGAYAFISTKHPYPTTDGINWEVGAGFLTISGSSASTYTVGFQVKLP